MKKSWHPLLLKNQERVWLEEKKAVCLTQIRMTLHLLTLCASSSSVQPVRSSSAQAAMAVSRASIQYASFDSTHA